MEKAVGDCFGGKAASCSLELPSLRHLGILVEMSGRHLDTQAPRVASDSGQK